MAGPLEVEPTGSAEFGACECCGSVTRRVWGFVHDPSGTVAAYFVQWAVGRVVDHGALFDLILGRWGDGASAVGRVLVALDYRVTDTGPAFMVVDAADRPANSPDVVERALGRSEVVGQPIAGQVYPLADALLAQDTRIAELLGQHRAEPARKPW